MNFTYQLVSGSEGQANKGVGKEQYRDSEGLVALDSEVGVNKELI